MSKAFDKVMDGLADADSYLNGERDGFKVHAIEVPEPDVVAIRSKARRGCLSPRSPRASALRSALSRIGNRAAVAPKEPHACYSL